MLCSAGPWIQRKRISSMCLLMPAATCTLCGVRPPAFYPGPSVLTSACHCKGVSSCHCDVGWADHPWWHGPDGAFMVALHAQPSLLSGTWPDMDNVLLSVSSRADKWCAGPRPEHESLCRPANQSCRRDAPGGAAVAAEDPALLGQEGGPRPHLADESREAHALDGPRFCAQQPELSVAKLEMQHLQLVTPVESLQDEGACWAPNAIWPSIMLTHWGRKVCT